MPLIDPALRVRNTSVSTGCRITAARAQPLTARVTEATDFLRVSMASRSVTERLVTTVS